MGSWTFPEAQVLNRVFVQGLIRWAPTLLLNACTVGQFTVSEVISHDLSRDTAIRSIQQLHKLIDSVCYILNFWDAAWRKVNRKTLPEVRTCLLSSAVQASLMPWVARLLQASTCNWCLNCYCSL